jgi:hypothetical protein
VTETFCPEGAAGCGCLDEDPCCWDRVDRVVCAGEDREDTPELSQNRYERREGGYIVVVVPVELLSRCLYCVGEVRRTPG